MRLIIYYLHIAVIYFFENKCINLNMKIKMFYIP